MSKGFVASQGRELAARAASPLRKGFGEDRKGTRNSDCGDSLPEMQGVLVVEKRKQGICDLAKGHTANG